MGSTLIVIHFFTLTLSTLSMVHTEPRLFLYSPNPLPSPFSKTRLKIEGVADLLYCTAEINKVVKQLYYNKLRKKSCTLGFDSCLHPSDLVLNASLEPTSGTCSNHRQANRMHDLHLHVWA